MLLRSIEPLRLQWAMQQSGQRSLDGLPEWSCANRLYLEYCPVKFVTPPGDEENR